MAKSSPFFKWWNREDAPLGLALQWIASRGDRHDPFETSASGDASTQVVWVLQSSMGADDDAVAYGLTPEAKAAWNDAEEELMRAIRNGSLPISGLQKGRLQAERLPGELFAYVKASTAGETDAECFKRITDTENVFLEFGAYDAWPHCDGDTLRKCNEIV